MNHNVTFATDTEAVLPHADDMDNQSEAKLLSADKLENGVVITFKDGRCALYSAALLNSIFSQAEEVDYCDTEEWPG